MKAYICRICGNLQFKDIPERCHKCGGDEREFLLIENYLKISQHKTVVNSFNNRLLKRELFI